MKHWVLFFIVSAFVSACAASEPRVKRAAPFQGISLDLSLLNYLDLASGTQVNVAEFMQTSDVDHLLLVFGSVGCAACNDKALELSNHYLARHQLFLDERFSSFAMVGVNVDQGGAKRQFDRIWHDMELRHSRGYDFVAWQELSDSIATYFILPGERATIPLVVLLTPEGIARRYRAEQDWQIGQILNDVLLFMGASDVPPDDRKPSEEKPPVRPSTPEGIDRWQIPVSDRFFDLPLDVCGTSDDSLIYALRTKLEPGAMRVLKLIPDACDQRCRDQSSLINQEIARCGESARSTCHFISLHVAKSQDLCENDQGAFTQPSVYKAFSRIFDWDEQRYPRDFDEFGLPVAVPPVTDPITLVFSRAGSLLMATDDSLSRNELRSALQGNSSSSGAAFGLYAGSGATSSAMETDFLNVRTQAKYTVVTMYAMGCLACEQELVSWSAPDNLFSPLHYCQKNSQFCQVKVLEKAPPSSYGRSAAELYDDIYTSFSELGIDYPIMIDTGLVNDEFGSFYESYLEVLFPEMFGNSATVIFDQEGKIIASFIGSDTAKDRQIMQLLQDISKVMNKED